MSRHRTSLAGLIVNGLVILLPLVLLGALIEVLYGVLAGWISPLIAAMPGIVLGNALARFVAVIIAVLLLALLLGALANTQPGQRVGRTVERAILGRVPFYNVLRVMVAGLTGRDDADAMKPVLLTVDEPGLQQFGFLLETHADGRSTVFLPGSPNFSSGNSVIVAPERVQHLPVPPREVLRCLFRWGHGSAALIKAMEDSPSTTGPQSIGDRADS